jgi:5,10-methylenetetrahydromethanopterin reductase
MPPSDARVVQEAAGPGRFLLGFWTSKIFLNNTQLQTNKSLGPMRDAVAIVRGVLSGEEFSYEGERWRPDVPALQVEAHAPARRPASTPPRRRRRCRRSPARSPTGV